MSDLPVNVDTTYDDSASDASVKLHQQHHDAIHALYNDISGATPDLANQGIEAAGAAAAAQAAAVQRANHTGTQAQSTVTNLVSDLAAKAPLASPTFTGTPTAPTAAPGTNSTQVATTEYVDAIGSGVTVQDEGTPLATAGTTLNFVGSTVAATGTGTTKTITIGASGLTLVETKVAGVGGVASFDFTSIAADYENLIMTGQVRSTTAADNTPCLIRFNNDSGSNYTYQRITGLSSAVGGAQALSQTSGQVMIWMTAANAAAGFASPIRVEVPGYARTAFKKHWQSEGGYHLSMTSVGKNTMNGIWDSAAAITRVTLLPFAGNFAEGSHVSLYGTPKA